MWFSRERAKKCLKRGKKDKILENLGKNVQTLEIFWKRVGYYVGLSHTIKC